MQHPENVPGYDQREVYNLGMDSLASWLEAWTFWDQRLLIYRGWFQWLVKVIIAFVVSLLGERAESSQRRYAARYCHSCQRQTNEPQAVSATKLDNGMPFASGQGFLNLWR